LRRDLTELPAEGSCRVPAFAGLAGDISGVNAGVQPKGFQPVPDIVIANCHVRPQHAASPEKSPNRVVYEKRERILEVMPSLGFPD
jgi:hypothetical protein